MSEFDIFEMLGDDPGDNETDPAETAALGGELPYRPRRTPERRTCDCFTTTGQHEFDCPAAPEIVVVRGEPCSDCDGWPCQCDRDCRVQAMEFGPR